jgi:predicted MFS family arabinose efflux permease
MTCILVLGVLTGTLITGQLSDWYGRRRLLMGILGLQIISQTIVGFSINWQMYTAMRFIVGATLGG